MRGPLPLRTLAAALAICGSQGLLLAGFAIAGRVDGMVAALVCALGWVLVLALAASEATLCLVASLGLGVLGALAGAPGWITTTAAGASLAAWDLTLLGARGAAPADEPGERRLLRSHLRALAAGILPGLALAILLGRAQVAIPFAAMVVLVGVALLSLHGVARRWR